MNALTAKEADLFLTMTSVATFKHFDLGGDPHGKG